MFSKEPNEKSQEDVSKTGNGYHQDPEMNHGPLRGHLWVPKEKKIDCKFLNYRMRILDFVFLFVV